MTREEAIEALENATIEPTWGGSFRATSEALKMAIEALKDQDRPIICPRCGRTFAESEGARMTIQGAISELRNLFGADDIPLYYKPVIEKVLETIVDELPSADRPRGEWVKKTFGYGECPDCIDRQELIGSIQYLFDGLADLWVEASEKIIEIIREEPTVPQKEYTEQQIRDTFNSGYSCGMQNEWITDEPPVDGQEVIATVYWTDYGDTITAYGHYNARFDTWSLYSDVEGGLNKGFEVIAWMPLPEPYKGGEDE